MNCTRCGKPSRVVDTRQPDIIERGEHRKEES